MSAAEWGEAIGHWAIGNALVVALSLAGGWLWCLWDQWRSDRAQRRREQARQRALDAALDDEIRDSLNRFGPQVRALYDTDWRHQ